MKTITIIFPSLILIGCATTKSIDPQGISEALYTNLTCEEMGRLHVEKTYMLAAVSDAYNKANRSGLLSSIGSVIDTVNIFKDLGGIDDVALELKISSGSLQGLNQILNSSPSNQKAEIARLKGEIIALEKAAKLKGCTTVKPS